MSEAATQAKHVFAMQPLSVSLGVELADYSPGLAVLHVPIKQEHRQPSGAMNSGVISYIVDSALVLAARSVLGLEVATSELKINYHRPIVGDSIVVSATVVHSSKTQAISHCDVVISDEQGHHLCATAHGTFIALHK